MLKVPFIENSNHFSILINIWNQISNNSIFSSMFFVILIFVHRMDTFVKLPKSVFTSKLFVGSNDSFNQQQHQQQQQQQRSLNNNQRLEDLFSTTTTITKSPVSTPLKQRNPFNSSTLNSSDMFDINDLTNSFNGSLRKNNNNNNININNNHNMEGLISSLNIEDQDIYNSNNNYNNNYNSNMKNKQINGIIKFIEFSLVSVFRVIFGIFKDIFSFFLKYKQFILGFGVCFFIILYNHKIQFLFNKFFL